ncbi:GCN5-related N-acetyltransferase [Parvularcula sp. ZS-1/3]|uniref:GCN5-related N-acetyltransferase n=1 Tax=Parvularcula mediterranea TaxID=2732508 RepID=A0A7Y3RJM1_9PROT|nr:GCN5-related N-acetyltransferase [Parvularcula mediterranea]NNU15288.1 GCN5-related N-acetyltransferase [Parvularcula mediterranea]
MNRRELENRWLRLTREEMPSVARSRGWPVVFDHCFQRILLDNAAGQVWYEVIERRPAYRHAEESLLTEAIALGEAALRGEADLAEMNRESLRLRGKL